MGIHDLLSNCVSLAVFKVFSLKLANYNEERFMKLFLSKTHLQKLEELSLNFRTSCPITAQFVHFLAETCPKLEYLGNLLSWNLRGLDHNLLTSSGRALVMATKSHWSLPWRSEDGRFHDVDSGAAGQGCVTDLYDNR